MYHLCLWSNVCTKFGTRRIRSGVWRIANVQWSIRPAQDVWLTYKEYSPCTPSMCDIWVYRSYTSLNTSYTSLRILRQPYVLYTSYASLYVCHTPGTGRKLRVPNLVHTRVYLVNTDYTLCTSAIRPVKVVYFNVSHTPHARSYNSCTKFGAYIRPYITDDTLNPMFHRWYMFLCMQIVYLVFQIWCIH